jgi:DNA-binding response OmpR family regulator
MLTMENAGLGDRSFGAHSAWLHAETPDAPRILVVEDDEDIRDLLVTLLSLSGYGVRAVDTAEAGLRALRESPFEFLLTDYALPGRSGAWLLKEASAEGLLEMVPVLVITAHPNPSGLDGFEVLQKPFEADDLLDRVQQHIAAPRPLLDTDEEPAIPSSRR